MSVEIFYNKSIIIYYTLKMSKDKRVKANLNNDSYITVNLEQEFDQLKVLSLSLSQDDIYANFNADFGVIVGRVIANGGVGVPNVKVSVFIPIQEEDLENELLLNEYNYSTPNDVGRKGKRYNLLNRIRRLTGFSLNKKSNGEDDLWDINRHMAGFTPKRIIGDFPEKIEVLQNNTKLEVYKKYYKYTTLTNSAGDYMLYGIPLGQQTVHIDADLSDIGELSLTPASFKAQGYPDELFDGSKFKPCNNLDECIQLESQNVTVDVKPFWGDRENFEIGLTRQDFNLRKTLFPTFVVFGAAPAMDKDTWWGDRVIFRVFLEWKTVLKANDVCFCLKVRVLGNDIINISATFPGFPICFPWPRFVTKSRYDIIKGGFYNQAPVDFHVLEYPDFNNKTGSAVQLTVGCGGFCDNIAFGCTKYKEDDELCGDEWNTSSTINENDYVNFYRNTVTLPPSPNVNIGDVPNTGSYNNNINQNLEPDYGIIPCFPKKNTWLSGTTYSTGTEITLLKYQPNNPASTIYVNPTSFRLNTSFPLLRDTTCDGEPGWTYPTPNSVNTLVNINDFPDYVYFTAKTETLTVSYTPRQCVSVYTATTLTNLENLDKSPFSSSVVNTGLYTDGTSVLNTFSNSDFYDASFNNLLPLREENYWEQELGTEFSSWNNSTTYNIGDTVDGGFGVRYKAVDVLLFDKLNALNKTLTNENIPPEAPSANTYVTLIFDDFSTENGIILTTGEIRIVYTKCDGSEHYGPFTTPRFVTDFWGATSLSIPNWNKGYIAPIVLEAAPDKEDKRDSEGTDRVKFSNSQNFISEFEVYSNINTLSNKEFVRVNPRSFELYTEAGQFAMRIPCDRRRMITSETGELIDSPDDSIGVFTEFDGYMFTKPTIEAGNTGLSDKATYVSLRIPQSTSVYNDYENYRKDSRIFKFGRYYSVAQKFGDINRNNDNYRNSTKPEDKNIFLRDNCNTCHGLAGAIDLTPFSNSPKPQPNYDFYDGMMDILRNYNTNGKNPCFWGEWLNLTIYHYNFIYRIRKNRGKSRYNPNIYGGELWYDEDEKKVGDEKVGRNFISNGSYIKTDFIEVPKADILAILDRTVNIENETLLALKGFTVTNTKTLRTSKDGLNVIFANIEGYDNYKSNGTNKYFYVGAKQANCTKFIKDLELI